MRKTQILPGILALALILGACSSSRDDMTDAESGSSSRKNVTDAVDGRENPLLRESDLDLHYPRFDLIEDADFGPAFDRGMKEQLREIQNIVRVRSAPTFENTIVALERSGRLLSRTRELFGNLVSADTNEDRQAIDVRYSPLFSAHEDAIWLDPQLYARVKAIHERRNEMGLDAESLRLVERYHTRFVRAGADLDETRKSRLKAINTELATLTTDFGQKVLAEVNDSAVLVEDRSELAGLSEAQIEAAADAARERGLEGRWLLALLNTSGQPVNADLENRALRRRVQEASLARGSRGNAFDTRAIISRVAKLRAERAALLGFESHAAYVLDDGTAKTPGAVNALLRQLAPAAVANARAEAADIQRMIEKSGAGFEAESYDWDFYAAKVKKARFDFDESELKPYLEFESVLEKGVFFAAEELFGIRFERRHDLPVYHPDVRVYDVFEADGEQLAIFLLDPYARPTKRGGAWMNSYVDQSKLLGLKPVVANHMNITEPAEGQPALMTWDEVITLFHEFGHALHGMFSDVQYPLFSGTSVPRDFVEYPSQVNEMWASWPSVLRNYARHHETGEPMPAALLQRVLDAGKFNQGYMTTEYLAAALIDQRLHQLSAAEIPDADGMVAFEAEALMADGVDYALVPPRYRLFYFSHIMGGYSAGYYSYIWSEVLDADSVMWFKEAGGLERKNGDYFREKILSPGGSIEAMQMFREFRGRDADIKHLLERRGLNRR